MAKKIKKLNKEKEEEEEEEEEVTLWDLHEALDRVSMQAAFFEIVCGSTAIKNIRDLKEKAEAVGCALGELYGAISEFYCDRSDQDERKAYVDMVGFDHHIEGDSNGTTLYPTPEDLLKDKSCAEDCGIAEVWITRVKKFNKTQISKNKKWKKLLQKKK